MAFNALEANKDRTINGKNERIENLEEELKDKASP